MILVQGLNVSEMKNDCFEINTESFDIESLDNFFMTIESIYMIYESSAFILKEKKFKNLFDDRHKNIEIISSSSNTNYFWCLINSNKFSKLELIQFSNDEIHKTIELNYIDNSKSLQLISTDINTYIFDNSSNGLKCIFELKTKQELEQKILEQESKLNEDSISSIDLNKVLIDEKIAQFSAGKEHILALTESKKVFSFGIGIKGQLGNSEIGNSFKFIKIFESATNLTTGNSGWHSGLIDSNQQCYLWGWNSNNQLGTLNQDSAFVTQPTKLNLTDDLTGTEILFKKISTGSKHTILVDCDFNLYTFGWNKYTQLFLENDHENENNDFDIDSPVKIIEFNNKVLDAKCGPWSTLLLLKN